MQLLADGDMGCPIVGKRPALPCHPCTLASSLWLPGLQVSSLQVRSGFCKCSARLLSERRMLFCRPPASNSPITRPLCLAGVGRESLVTWMLLLVRERPAAAGPDQGPRAREAGGGGEFLRLRNVTNCVNLHLQHSSRLLGRF